MSKRQELLEEKKRLEKRLAELDKKLRPEMISDDKINWGNLKAMVVNIMDDYEDEGRSKDDENYIYECVMTTLYGPDVFDWINSKSDEN